MVYPYIRVFLITFALVCIGQCFKIQPRIVNGVASKRGEFPFYALLRITSNIPNGPPELICGGTLLNNQFILTAAHCLYKAVKVQVDLGSLEMNNIEEVGRKSYFADEKQMFVHPNYDHPTLREDIAIIRLNEQVIFSDVIQPVAFPNECSVAENTNLIAIGNGYYNNNNELSPILQYTQLKSVASKVCKEIYPFIDENKVFCAEGPNGQSICKGDSGGPLVHATQRTLFGITSFHYIQGCQLAPQGFTNVFSYMPFITQITGIQFPNCQ